MCFLCAEECAPRGRRDPGGTSRQRLDPGHRETRTSCGFAPGTGRVARLAGGPTRIASSTASPSSATRRSRGRYSSRTPHRRCSKAKSSENVADLRDLGETGAARDDTHTRLRADHPVRILIVAPGATAPPPFSIARTRAHARGDRVPTPLAMVMMMGPGQGADRGGGYPPPPCGDRGGAWSGADAGQVLGVSREGCGRECEGCDSRVIECRRRMPRADGPAPGGGSRRCSGRRPSRRGRCPDAHVRAGAPMPPGTCDRHGRGGTSRACRATPRVATAPAAPSRLSVPSRRRSQ